MLRILLLCSIGVTAHSAPTVEVDWDKLAREARQLRTQGSAGGASVLDALEARARHVLEGLQHPTNRETWQQAVPGLRKQLMASLGLSHLPKPLARNVRTVGTIVRDSYVIEKLIYETLPGTQVPVHVYRPARVKNGKGPAILFVPGHWWADSKSRPDFQAFCITMARWGFVVLTYDPFGQGERGISLRDHRRTELLLIGVAQQGVVVFESLCALEYLLSRPDVDPERIGMTGASGGGFNSWILPAIEPRIAVTVPVVGTSEFYEQLHVCRPLDWYRAKEHCHFVPGLLRYANNHELLATVAPRPVKIIAAHNDQSFPMPGIRKVAAYGRRLFTALGSPERMGYFEDAVQGHGYQKKKREEAYGWFCRWLKGEGDGRAIPEPPTTPFPWDADELRCFPRGENRPAGPGMVSYARTVAEKLPPREETPRRETMEKALIKALGLPFWNARLYTGPKLEQGSFSVAAGLRVKRALWRLKDGVTIPAIFLKPRGRCTGALLAACDDGKETLLGHTAIRTAIDSGMAVLLADLRGFGELAIDKPGWAFAVSLLLG